MGRQIIGLSNVYRDIWTLADSRCPGRIALLHSPGSLNRHGLQGGRLAFSPGVGNVANFYIDSSLADADICPAQFVILLYVLIYYNMSSTYNSPLPTNWGTARAF
jgi:hypothetical protein